ncbi:hypothetical protein KI387_011848, partial [Taxus chinensis]
LVLQVVPRMMIIAMKGTQMEEHVEEVFVEDFMVTVTMVEDEVNSCEEPIITMDLQSITS